MSDGAVVERLVRVEAVAAGEAWVTAARGCGGCADKGACGHAELFGAPPPARIKVADSLGVRPGEWVVLGLPEGALLGALALAYGLPLGGFVLGALAGAAFGAGAAIAAAALGLGLALGLARFVFAPRRAARPTMLRRAAAPARCPPAT